MIETKTERIPIQSWADNVDDNAMAQAKNLANLPFAFHHIALMPDAHLGYGMPIGGVLATKGVVIPNCVGSDVGCGMIAVRTDVPASTLKTTDGRVLLKKILAGIRASIPVGFNRHKKQCYWDEMPPPNGISDDGIVTREFEKARYQLGTLGGGNHFQELQEDENGFLWVMIHSGSRNLGFQVAKHHNNVAKKLNARWYSTVPIKWDLAFLPMESEEAHDYTEEMNYCVEFALKNRLTMMNVIQGILTDVICDVKFYPAINIAHNYAAIENHFGHNVVVHRKGATSAKKGEQGIIPGSQGTASYIVEGLGNIHSFRSCSHGAGRVMGRKQAIRELDLKEQVKAMDDAGILHSIRGKKDLDEAPGAYKDIEKIMELQKDLVKITHRLTPLAVVKG